MALRDNLGEMVTGVDLSQGMLDKFNKKAEGKGVTTFALEARAEEGWRRVYVLFSRSFPRVLWCHQ